MRLRTTVSAAAVGVLLLVSHPALAAGSIFGRWVTDDRSAVVRIAPCGHSLCGVIERVLNPKAPRNDVNNPDPARRSRPLVGTPVLTGFRPGGAEWSGGRAYDPKVGRSYRSKLKLDGDNRLQVTGCVLVLCRSLYWSRAN